MAKFSEQPANPIEENESEDKYRAISEAKSFEELFAALDQLGSLEGSRKTYSAENLKEKINKVREGFGIIYLQRITRTGGLREKVIELIAQEGQKD